jgi:hypothetical protein
VYAQYQTVWQGTGIYYCDIAHTSGTFATDLAAAKWIAIGSTLTAHATTHKSGESDEILLDELGAPTDVTTLNASTTLHGLLPKIANNINKFLSGKDGTWTEQVYVEASGNDAQALTANSTNITFVTEVVDSHAAWDGTTFTAPRADTYTITFHHEIASLDSATIVVYKNGSAYKRISENSSTKSQILGALTVRLALNDTINFRSSTNVTGAATDNTSQWVIIKSER